MTILEEAAKATGGDRPGEYGHPLDHFQLTVDLVNARFASKLREPFTVEDWPIVMVLDKLARHAHRRQRDSLVDVAGYARTAEMVEEERARRAAVQETALSNRNGHGQGLDTARERDVRCGVVFAPEAVPVAQPDGDPHALDACP